MSPPILRAPPAPRLRGVATPILCALGLVALGACGDAGEAGPAPTRDASAAAPRNSIVDVAKVAGQFSTLIAAVEAAGLTRTLDEDGPFTVFAPTDGAFQYLPEGTVEALLDDPETLAGILLYHVVPGTLKVADLRERTELETVHGAKLQVRATAQGITINDTYLLTSDVAASNGVIHVITSVLVPEGE